MRPPRPLAHVLGAGAYLPGRSVPGLVKLSSNESVVPPSAAVQAAIAEAAAGLNRYPPHLPALVREAVARYLVDHAGAPGPLAPERVLVGNGSVTLLRQVFEAYVDDGDRVVVAWPSFEAYPLFAHLRRAAFVRVPLAEGLFDVDGLVAAVADPSTRLVLLTSPNNPTGAELAHADVERILAAAPDDCVVVLDNAYGEFQRNVDGVAPLALLDDPRVLVLRTLAKAFSLAGLRVGYGVGHPDVVEAVDRVRSPFEVNALAQVAAVAALAEAPAVLARCEAAVAERRRCIAALWDGGLPVGESQGNFVWLATGPATATFVERFAADGYVVRAFPGDGIRVTVVDPADDDAWVASALRTWGLPELAPGRERVAAAVAAARPSVATGTETAASQALSYATATLLQA
jgi:histidinol-phosphate aminotransferase